MLLDPRTAILFDAASGALFIALGTYVASSLRPRNETTLLVASFSVLLGLAIAVQNVAFAIAGDNAWWPQQAAVAAGALGAAALIILLLRFPSPASRRELVAAGVLGTLIAWDLRTGTLLSNGIRPAATSFAFAAAFLAVRAGGAPADSRERRVMILMAAALCLFPAFGAGRGLHAWAATGPNVWGLFPIVLLVAVATVLWTVHMIRWEGGDASRARIVVWLLLGCSLAGLVVEGIAPALASDGVPGLMRTASVLVLAFAILRQRFLGVDVTARFAISRSTIAAIFVAAFFIVSEAAQQFFGDTLESTYLGIAAAGALVFALAPLSTLADRIAEKAVPPSVQAAPAKPETPDREEAYRNAVQLALRDQGLSRTEERSLFLIASALGIHAGRAHEILAEVEKQVQSKE